MTNTQQFKSFYENNYQLMHFIEANIDQENPDQICLLDVAIKNIENDELKQFYQYLIELKEYEKKEKFTHRRKQADTQKQLAFLNEFISHIKDPELAKYSKEFTQYIANIVTLGNKEPLSPTLQANQVGEYFDAILSGRKLVLSIDDVCNKINTYIHLGNDVAIEYLINFIDSSINLNSQFSQHYAAADNNTKEVIKKELIASPLILFAQKIIAKLASADSNFTQIANHFSPDDVTVALIQMKQLLTAKLSTAEYAKNEQQKIKNNDTALPEEITNKVSKLDDAQYFISYILRKRSKYTYDYFIQKNKENLRLLCSHKISLSEYISKIHDTLIEYYGHAGIAVSMKKNNEDSANIIFSAGFNKINQICYEDIRLNPNCFIKHKTYPISKSQLESLLLKLNADRHQPPHEKTHRSEDYIQCFIYRLNDDEAAPKNNEWPCSFIIHRNSLYYVDIAGKVTEVKPDNALLKKRQAEIQDEMNQLQENYSSIVNAVSKLKNSIATDKAKLAAQLNHYNSQLMQLQNALNQLNKKNAKLIKLNNSLNIVDRFTHLLAFHMTQTAILKNENIPVTLFTKALTYKDYKKIAYWLGQTEPMNINFPYESIPSSPSYKKTYTCKSYALDLLKHIGISDRALENSFIDLPLKSGPLANLQFEFDSQTKMKKWTTPMTLSPTGTYEEKILIDLRSEIDSIVWRLDNKNKHLSPTQLDKKESINFALNQQQPNEDTFATLKAEINLLLQKPYSITADDIFNVIDKLQKLAETKLLHNHVIDSFYAKQNFFYKCKESVCDGVKNLNKQSVLAEHDLSTRGLLHQLGKHSIFKAKRIRKNYTKLQNKQEISTVLKH